MSAALARPSPLPPTVADPAQAEFAYQRSDFEAVRRLIRDRAGIHLADGKEAMVYSRLARRLRDTGHRAFGAYLAWLESQAPASEWQSFVNALTTNLTSFFRESHHFDELAEVARRHREPEFRVWCSAASTGEEPYSIAMTLAESLPAGVEARIVASDIDTDVLATAAAAVYAADSRGLDAERLRRHCQRGAGTNAGRLRIKPELARRVDFRVVNLVDAREWNLGLTFHAVFCRNVMIYFDAATQAHVLERIHRVMEPGSRLYVGHSESLGELRHLFRLRGQTVYERVG